MYPLYKTPLIHGMWKGGVSFLKLIDMKLITYENYEIKIADEALLVGPIRKLFNKDRTAKKETFLQQMSILFFYADPRSSYSYITDDKLRLEAIIEQEGLPANYKLSKEMLDLIELYKKMITTTSLLLLQDTRTAIDKVREFLRNIDLDERNNSGMPVYSVATVTSTIAKIPQLIKDLNDAEKTVAKEIEEAGRTRGSVQKKLFEDGF